MNAVDLYDTAVNKVLRWSCKLLLVVLYKVKKVWHGSENSLWSRNCTALVCLMAAESDQHASPSRDDSRGDAKRSQLAADRGKRCGPGGEVERAGLQEKQLSTELCGASSCMLLHRGSCL